MSWVGCYALDLYCDNQAQTKDRKPMQQDGKDGVHEWNEFPHQYTDEHGSAARAKARRAGWILHSDGSAICPKCSGKRNADKAAPLGEKVK